MMINSQEPPRMVYKDRQEWQGWNVRIDRNAKESI